MPRASTIPTPISYPDERLRPILESSKGVILYQEQAMQISKELAGFSGAKADDLRKAIGKKNREAMAALKPEFVEGCRASGTRPEVIEFLWQTNETSADYSFNRVHAACYALIAYRTAWLKANYTAEYMAALISSVMSTKDKVPFFVARCEEMGIEILPPDVNLSDHEFTVGPPAVEGDVGGHPLRPGRRQGRRLPGRRGDQAGPDEGGEFTSLWDFCERVDCRTVNKKAIEALIKCGALGSTGATRKGMLDVLERPRPRPENPAGRADRPGLDLRPAGGDARHRTRPGAARLGRPVHPPILGEEFDQPEMLAAEKEAIGLFVSAHPLKPLKEVLRARVDCPLSSLADRRDKDIVTVGGIITETKRIRTRNGDHMMFATLDDLAGSVEMLVFGKALASTRRSSWPTRSCSSRDGSTTRRPAATCLVVQSVQRFAPSAEEIERARRQGRGGRRGRGGQGQAGSSARHRQRASRAARSTTSGRRSRTSRARPRC